MHLAPVVVIPHAAGPSGWEEAVGHLSASLAAHPDLHPTVRASGALIEHMAKELGLEADASGLMLLDAAAPGATLLKVELVEALERAFATTLVDLLHRRTMVGLGADFGVDIAAAAADALVSSGVWDRARADNELEACAAYAVRHDARAGRRPGALSVR